MGAERISRRYIEKYVDVDHTDVCAGIIYPSAPTAPGLKERIEEYLNEYGLQVVWYDSQFDLYSD